MALRLKLSSKHDKWDQPASNLQRFGAVTAEDKASSSKACQDKSQPDYRSSSIAFLFQCSFAVY